MGDCSIHVFGLARIAVDKKLQERGSESSSREIPRVAEMAVVRNHLTHPIDQEDLRFYLRFGFDPPPVPELQLMILVKDFKKLLKATSLRS